MQKGSAKKKTQQLGINFGTASGRLKKNIFLMLLQKLGLDICYRCKLQIVNPADLTIDHKKDWLDVNVALFWDLNNIAFSHSKCNVPSRRPGGAILRRKTKDGWYWCASCREEKLANEFSNKKSRWNGKHQNCKTCVKQIRDKWKAK